MNPFGEKIKTITPIKEKIKVVKKEDTANITQAYIQKNKLALLLDDVEAGIPPNISATAHDIDLNKWLERPDIVKRLSQAEAKAICSYLKNISKEAKKSGSLSKEMIQILWPSSFQKAPVSARQINLGE